MPLTGRVLRASGLRGLLLGVLLLTLAALLSPLATGVSPTAQDSREPSTGQADDLVSTVITGRDGVVGFWRVGRCPAATSYRAAESGAGLADHGTVGVLTTPWVGIRTQQYCLTRFGEALRHRGGPMSWNENIH
ncbi:MAG: hypothetical protein M3302_05595 [Actinomycetota bacterium]|nr:hypothetical protein [Actinomycetota bacterium]